MRTRIHTLGLVVALLGAGAMPARGQDTVIDSRWLAYLGCWQPIEGGDAKSRVCVVPATPTSAVDLVTITPGQVVGRERIAATGERLETARGDCPGWQSAEWSALGDRLYLRSGDGCPRGRTQVGTGLIAMTAKGQWLYIQGITLGGQTGVRVERYQETTSDLPLPNDIMDALRPTVLATSQARAAAAAPLSIDDVVEASGHLDAAVLEAWLVERAAPFRLDAKRLIALADARVPSRVIDLMIALSYPNVFAINAATRQGERRAASDDFHRRSTGSSDEIVAIDRLCSMPGLFLSYAYAYDCTGLAPGNAYGYGWYPGGYPVTIQYIGSAGSGSQPHGRVVNGRGYKEGPSTGANTMPGSPASGGWSSGSGASPSSSSTSSSSGDRSAKPRPPQ